MQQANENAVMYAIQLTLLALDEQATKKKKIQLFNGFTILPRQNYFWYGLLHLDDTLHDTMFKIGSTSITKYNLRLYPNALDWFNSSKTGHENKK